MGGVEPACPFGCAAYRPAQREQAQGRIDVPALLRQADARYAKNDAAGAAALLEAALAEADALGDRAGALGVRNELLGCYRRTGQREKALACAEEALALVGALGLDGSATAGTVLLNAATVHREFGDAAQAVELYKRAARAYSAHLDAGDYRFAALYNNLAASLAETGERAQAEAYYQKALALLRRLPGCGADEALTLVNLACFYGDADSADERAGRLLAAAKAVFDRPQLPRDAYYAFCCRKCVGAFSHYGFFTDARELSRRAEEIDAVS